MQTALRPSDSHIHQPALFLNSHRQGIGKTRRIHILIVATEMRQQAFFDSEQIHMRVFKSLGRVQGGQLDRIGLFFLPALKHGHQRDVLLLMLSSDSLAAFRNRFNAVFRDGWLQSSWDF